MRRLLRGIIDTVTGRKKQSTLHTHSTWISQEIELKVLEDNNAIDNNIIINRSNPDKKALNSNNDSHSSSGAQYIGNQYINEQGNEQTRDKQKNSPQSITASPQKEKDNASDNPFYSKDTRDGFVPIKPRTVLERKKTVFNLDHLDDLAIQTTHQIFILKERHSTYFNFELILEQWDMNMSFLTHLNQELMKREQIFEQMMTESNGFIKIKGLVEDLILSLYNQHYPATIKSL